MEARGAECYRWGRDFRQSYILEWMLQEPTSLGFLHCSVKVPRAAGGAKRLKGAAGSAVQAALLDGEDEAEGSEEPPDDYDGYDEGEDEDEDSPPAPRGAGEPLCISRCALLAAPFGAGGSGVCHVRGTHTSGAPLWLPVQPSARRRSPKLRPAP